MPLSAGPQHPAARARIRVPAPPLTRPVRFSLCLPQLLRCERGSHRQQDRAGHGTYRRGAAGCGERCLRLSCFFGFFFLFVCFLLIFVIFIIIFRCFHVFTAVIFFELAPQHRASPLPARCGAARRGAERPGPAALCWRSAARSRSHGSLRRLLLGKLRAFNSRL